MNKLLPPPEHDCTVSATTYNRTVGTRGESNRSRLREDPNFFSLCEKSTMAVRSLRLYFTRIGAVHAVHVVLQAIV